MKAIKAFSVVIATLISFSVNAETSIDNKLNNATCALSTQHVGSKSSKRNKANEVIVFNHTVGEYFDSFSYRSSKSSYKRNSSGRGITYRIDTTEYDKITFRVVNSGGRNKVISKEMILKINRTTGSYPGGGSAPERITEFKCLFNYQDISSVTKRDVIRDFNL